jgi:hypothetical protein
VSKLDELTEHEKQKLKLSIKNEMMDEDDIISMHEDVYHKVEVFYPRLFCGPFLISLYAVLESSLNELAELIRSEKKVELKLKEINGDILEKAKCYFTKVLGIDLHTDDQRWQTINRLKIVRNCFAHQNGRIGYTELKNIKLQNIIEQNLGVERFSDVLVVNQSFVQTSLKAVVDFITDIEGAYRGAWLNNRNP